jgi:hypothetical protein
MGYPYVNILSSINYNASGTVSYASIFCSNDDYSVSAHTDWQATSRGVCLVTEITATVDTPNGRIQATPYTSSGTSYALFAIVQTSPNAFAVTRVVTGAEDVAPSDHVEPTEQQK